MKQRVVSRRCIPESSDPRYAIAPGWSKGKLWIEHESGEGGDFDAEGVVEAVRHNCLHDFYARNF